MAAKERNYLIDNCKALLILLVVVGHMLTLGPRENSDMWAGVWAAIYAFHMPAFMFLSGVFAKSDGKSAAKSVLKLSVLFITMTVLVCLTRMALGEKPGFSLVLPVFSAWFLLSLATMRALLPALGSIKFVLPILVTVALLAPIDGHIGGFLSFARTLYLLPFFMAGYLLGLKGVVSFKQSMRGWRTAAIILAALALLAAVALLNHLGYIPRGAFFAKASYLDAGFDSVLFGMGMRCVMMVTAAACIAALLLILPDAKNPCTYIGENSLSVYMLQALLITVLEVAIAVYNPDFASFGYFNLGWALVAASIVFCPIAALPFINKVLGWPADMAVKYLLGDDPRAKKAA